MIGLRRLKYRHGGGRDRCDRALGRCRGGHGIDRRRLRDGVYGWRWRGKRQSLGRRRLAGIACDVVQPPGQRIAYLLDIRGQRRLDRRFRRLWQRAGVHHEWYDANGGEFRPFQPFRVFLEKNRFLLLHVITSYVFWFLNTYAQRPVAVLANRLDLLEVAERLGDVAGDGRLFGDDERCHDGALKTRTTGSITQCR